MDSHGAFACELLRRDGVSDGANRVDAIKAGGTSDADARLEALLHVVRTVAADARALQADDIARAHVAGASDGDVQLAVLIAAGFSMYNRMVDGLRAATPADPAVYGARAGQIADAGYAVVKTPPG